MTHATPLPFVLGKRLDDLDVLARSSLLRGMNIKEVSEFLDQLDQVALPQGTSIIREGDEGEYMYFVLEGEARLQRGQLHLHPVGPGDHFGELALLGGSKRAASVEAHTTMRLARLSRSRYLSLSTEHPRVALHFAQALVRALGEELVAMTDSVGLLTYQRALPRNVDVKVRRAAGDLRVATGSLVGTVLPRDIGGSLVVAATIDRKAASLEAALVADVDVGALTIADAEGRTVFRRSASLLLLEAARRIAPEIVLRMGPPLENAQVVIVETACDRAELATRLGIALEKLVHDDVPMREEVWQTEEARALFVESRCVDAAALLPSRRETTVSLLVCGETFALSLGPIVPRAGFLAGLRVSVHPQGVLLQLGPAVDRVMPMRGDVLVNPTLTEAEAPRYGAEMTRAGTAWLAGLDVTGVGRFNERCVSGQVDELIRVAEGFHEKWIGGIADLVAKKRDAVKVIVIAGPSSSGKTTFIKRLTVQLIVNGLRPKNVSLDDYYVDRDKTPRDDAGEWDFEAFEALDAVLLKLQLARLLSGETIRPARYDFVAGKSAHDGGAALALGPGDVLLLEGIHGLNPALIEGAVPPAAVFRIFVHPATTLAFDRASVLAPDDVRLVRRIVRDRHTRNNTAADTILRWPSVRRGELLHIYPFFANADAVFDSSLVYEMSVLKTYAERYLLEVPANHAAFTTAFRLRNLIDQFVAIYPDHVPPTSVIREFIGGSGFTY